MYDVFISGSGPAGVVLAMQLKQFGLQVLIAGSARRFAALEGMAERCRHALQAAGCEQALAATGLRVQRHAIWSGEEFSGNHEYLVERAYFDEALWKDAQQAGVEARRARIGKVIWHINHWRTQLGNSSVTARYWVEARGRQAPRTYKVQRAPHMLSLAAWWENTTSDSDSIAEAGVCTFADGWCWHARLKDGRLNLQLFVDAEQQRTAPRGELREHYLKLVNSCSEAKAMVAGMQLSCEPWARGANLTLSTPLIGNFKARVGDAALAHDPLAGHGMFEAVGSAMTLAPCIHTELQRPDDSKHAHDFYNNRMQDEFWHLARNARDFYALETRWPNRPFWLQRQQWPDAIPSHPEIQPGSGYLQARPVSIDGFIEQREVLICPNMPRGVWQVEGIPLPALIRQLNSAGLPDYDELSDFAARAGWTCRGTESAIRWLAQRDLLSVPVSAL